MSFASLELSTTTPFALSLSKGLFACYQPLSLRYRRPVSFAPLRVVDSSAYRRVRRVVAPAGESLSFVASNESNQSKDAEHQLIWSSRCGYKGSACHCHGALFGRTHAAISSPHASLRIGAIRIEAMRSEPSGEEIAAGVRLVPSMAWTGRTLVAEA